MCGYFCIGFIDFMLKGRSLLDYISLFSPKGYEKSDEKIKMKKIHCVICGKYRKFKNPKI